MLSGLCKILFGIVIVFAVFSLMNGHYKHTKRVAAGINSEVSYHVPPKSVLYCDGVIVGAGQVRYEGRVVKAKSVANSNGIWYIDNKVYKQKEGSICERSGR